MGAVGVPLCYKYVWSPLHYLSPSRDVQQREGNAAILAEFDSFLVERFHVKQKIEEDPDDSRHNVSVYLPNIPCNELQFTKITLQYNESFSPPLYPMYMLEHSLLSLHAFASTSDSENNPAFFDVLRSIKDSINFNQQPPSSKYFRKQIKIGEQTNVSLSISDSDYYAVHFSVPAEVTLTYSLSMEIRQIDVETINDTLFGAINARSDDQVVGESVKFGIGQYCLLADVWESNRQATHNYTTLETHMEPRVAAGVAITVSLLFVAFLAVFVVEVVVYMLARKASCYPRRRNYERVN